MKKDIVIAVLGGGHAVQAVPWFAACPADQRVVLWLGLSMLLLFFCLFLEETSEKWQKRREWKADMQAIHYREKWMEWLKELPRRRCV